MNLNLAAMSPSQAFTHIVQARLRNLLFKTAKQCSGFYSNKQHKVIDSGIVTGNYGVDLGLIRYACLFSYRYDAPIAGGNTAQKPTKGTLRIDVSFANTGAMMSIGGVINLNNGDILNREDLDTTLEAVSSTLRFTTFMDILSTLEGLNLMQKPNFTLTEGDESKYQDQLS